MARTHQSRRQPGDFPEKPGGGRESLIAHGFVSEFGTLSICTTCLGLFDDPVRGIRESERQECLCHTSDQPRWPGYDYNERARLCDCCGRYVLRSGSRWSVWFCEECKEQVRRLNEQYGFAVIPIGRHSMMHGFGLQGEPDKAEIERFIERFGDMRRRMGILHDDWKPAHLREELARLGLIARCASAQGTTAQGASAQGASQPSPVPLVTYLSAVADEDGRSGIDHRLQAFHALVNRFKGGR